MIEGLLVYLEREQVLALGQDLADAKTFERWITDLQSPGLLKMLQKNMGAQMTTTPMKFAPPEGPDVAFVVIAGLVARRIVCDLYEGQQIASGQRIGIIRFGSRVDIYCPPPYVPMVAAGQRMVGGETVLADRLAAEPPRPGVAQ